MEAMPILSEYTTYSHIKSLFKAISEIELGEMSYIKLKVTMNIYTDKEDCLVSKVILVSPKHNKTLFYKKYKLEHLRNIDSSIRDNELNIILNDIHQTHITNFNNGRYFTVTDKLNSDKNRRGRMERFTSRN